MHRNTRDAGPDVTCLLFGITIRIHTKMYIFHRLFNHRDGVRTFRFRIDAFATH